jgi:hypothetical protein
LPGTAGFSAGIDGFERGTALDAVGDPGFSAGMRSFLGDFRFAESGSGAREHIFGRREHIGGCGERISSCREHASRCAVLWIQCTDLAYSRCDRI